MPTEKYKQKLLKHRICATSRMIAGVSFLVLAIVAVSSLVRAMSLEAIANENGIPASWKAASLGNPETITVPITYWDQRQESCTDDNRQFEWSQCQLYTTGALQGVVKNYLGSDGLPIPAYTNSTDAWNAHKDIFTMNVTGHEPVVATDNFYRWFHETSVSKRFDREVTFVRRGNNTYTYGSKGVFPLDDVSFSKDDDATKTGHNFHFTSHLRIPVKIAADGKERFDFMGDDDVWVFLNGRLVLDIGGLHQAVRGHFVVNTDGSITTYVDSVAQPQNRTAITTLPSASDMNNSSWRSKYLSQVHNVAAPGKTETINIGLQAGDVVNLDFFYAERSTSESNTEITIANMNWPISADSDLNAQVVGKIETTDSNLIQFTSSITNRDPENPLDIERIAAYIEEKDTVVDSTGTTNTQIQQGYLPLSSKTLFYSDTPDDLDSWQPVEISAPENSANGFKLATPLRLGPSGRSDDTLYFRYHGESAELSGIMSSTISYYTSLDGAAGITYDHSNVTYETSRGYHQVKVSYRYEDDTEAAPTYTGTYRKDDTYEITSPEIENYKADITKVSGTVQDSDVEYTVYYRRIPVEPPVSDAKPKHTVTIKYVYEDGTPAAESYSSELEEGISYEVISPDIADYKPDQEKISGKMAGSDIEYTVIYTSIKVPAPEEPEKPETPITPDPGNTPLPPVISSSDIIDSELLYLAPLGAVAFVPNTGIVGSAVAGLFEDAFAEIILSQGFVMVTLLVFAGSFAAYFSHRKYLHLDLATISRKTVKKSHSKMPANKKVAVRAKTARNAHATHNKKITTKRTATRKK